MPGQRYQPELRGAEFVRGQPWTVYANDDGRVWIRGNLAAGNAVKFADDDDDPEPTHYLVEPDKWYDFRDKEVQVLVRAWPIFRVKVQYPDGRPVTEFDLDETTGEFRLVEEIEPGIWTATGVRPGQHMVYAHVDGSYFAVSGARRFNPLDFTERPLEFTIVEPTSLKLQLRTADGVALAAKVTLRRVDPDEANDVSWCGGDRWSNHAETDAKGFATMAAPADIVGWELYISKTAKTKGLLVKLHAGHQAQRLIAVTLPLR